MTEMNEKEKTTEISATLSPSGHNSGDLLGAKHTGMRVSASGLLGRIRDGWKVDQGQRYVAGVMLEHLTETSKRFYSGDVKAVDEFFQLYCLDDNRP